MWMSLLRARNLLDSSTTSKKKSFFFNSFFFFKLFDMDTKKYTYDNVKRWSKSFNIFEQEMVFIPINIGNAHWVLIVIFIILEKIEYYDSTGGGGCATIYLNIILKYLEDEAKDKKTSSSFVKRNWNLVHRSDIPQQNNGYDCGVFVCIYALLTYMTKSFSFTQSDMKLFRKSISLSILKCN